MYRLRLSRGVLATIRTLDDVAVAISLIEAMNQLTEEPRPESARRVLEDVELYVMRLFGFQIVFSVNDEERVVAVRELIRWPRPDA